MNFRNLNGLEIQLLWQICKIDNLMYMFVEYRTYDDMWREAMNDLSDQVHLEDNTLDLEEGESAPEVSSIIILSYKISLILSYLSNNRPPLFPFQKLLSILLPCT